VPAVRVQDPSEQASVGALVQRLGADVGRIVRAEIALFQLRLKAAFGVFKATGGGLAVAAMLGLTGFGVIVAGAVMILATIIRAWLAAFAVGAGLLVLAAVVAAIELRVLTHGVNEALAPVGGQAAGETPGEEARHGG
jgi:putative superfamily III holin-X